MHQIPDFNMRQNFLSLVIHRSWLQITEIHKHIYHWVLIDCNDFRSSQISDIASDLSLWFKMNTITLRKVVSIYKQPSPSLYTPQINKQILNRSENFLIVFKSTEVTLYLLY